MTRAQLTPALLAIAAACAACPACKDKPTVKPVHDPAPSQPAAPTTPPQPDKPRLEPPRPTLPTPETPSTGPGITVDEATKMLPDIESKQVLGPKPTSDGKQVHQTWCIDGDGADDVARKVGSMMNDAGYANISIRGDAKKAGVQGDRDVYKMSMVVSASSAANCPAPAHYFASATIFKQ